MTPFSFSRAFALPRFARALLLAFAFAGLAGCASNVKNEVADAQPVAGGVAKVSVDISEDGAKDLKDISSFDAAKLAEIIQNQLTKDGKWQTASGQQVRVQIDGMRFRSYAAAAVLGVLSGADTVKGQIQIVDGTGKVLDHTSFDLSNAALGGLLGGTNPVRMGYFYSEIAHIVGKRVKP